MLKKDSMWMGIVLGLLIPVLSFGLFYVINEMITKFITHRSIFTLATLVVVSIFVNVLVFRYYMLKLKADYTGRGILLATFIYAFIYFIKFF